MVEQSAVNRWVVGSNPIRGDIWIFGEISGSSVAIFSSHEKLFVIVFLVIQESMEMQKLLNHQDGNNNYRC